MINKEKILNIINSHPKHYSVIIKKEDDKKTFNEIKTINAKTFAEQTYIYVFGENKNRCICGNSTKFINFFKGYRQFCSQKCMANDNNIKEKKENTLFKNHGVKYALQSPKINKEFHNTMNQKYNVNHALQSKKIKEKQEETMIKRYGSKNYNNIEKQKETVFIKFYNNIKNRTPGFTPLFSLNDYTGVNKSYKFKCKKCNNIFEDNIDDGKLPRCLVCYPKLSNNTSIYEKEILNFIKSIYNEKIIENDRNILNGKELDIYLPNKKIAIEFDGLYWHSELNGKDKKYHLNKTKVCEKQGIQLIHIFEDEWLNKQEIVKSRLKHILGKSEDKIYARKCNIQEISPTEKNRFLNQYHLQGEDKSKVKLGLFYNEELIAVMTFGDRRIALGKKSTELGEHELIRYATSKNVIGGAGKLLNYFIKNYQPTKIISYADRRWSQGNLYENLNFIKIDDGIPNYWYIDNNQNRFHRFNFRKNILNKKLENFDSTLTEWQNMQNAGYDRIWDCGNLKFKLLVS